jgi:hypothetical protein
VAYLPLRFLAYLPRLARPRAAGRTDELAAETTVDDSHVPASDDRDPDETARRGSDWDIDPACREALEVPCEDPLRGSSARVVLARLIDGDPLELWPRCQQALREGGWLLSQQRLFLRAAAQTAYRARGYEGEPELGRWLEQNIQASIDDLLLEDKESERSEIDATESDDTRAGALAAILGMEPGTLKQAICRYHELADETRRAFFSTVVDGRAVESFAAENGLSSQEVERRVATAFEVLAGLRRGKDLR